MAQNRDPWVRWFDVTDPQRHPAGKYTIYKVTSKIFPVHSPEVSKEKVVWKRYNEFHKLHTALSTLHKNLHRTGVFPDFPRPTVFGRFDETVIEERRKAALETLNFIASQPYLFNTLHIQRFFETSELPPEAKQNQAQLDQPILQPQQIHPPSLNPQAASLQPDSSEVEIPQTLSGIWTHRRSDSTSSSSINSEPGGLNPQAELSLPEIPTQDSTDASPEALSADPEALGADPEVLSTNTDTGEGDTVKSDIVTPSQIAKEFDPLYNSESPAAVDSTTVMSNQALLNTPSPLNLTDSHGTDQSLQLPSPPDSLSELILTKGDYIYKAVKKLRRARRAQNEALYHNAFDYYKEAVSILLIGVQTETDDQRREIVRTNISTYLSYADELNKQYIDGVAQSSRWREDNSLTPRTITKLRGGLVELSQYKVIGVLHSNMIAVNKDTQDTYLIKVLQKNCEVDSSQRHIIPTCINHMVRLIRYFETETTVYLLLEYCSLGRTLYQYVERFLKTEENAPISPPPGLNENIYSAQRFNTNDETAVTSAKPANSQTNESVHIDKHINQKSNETRQTDHAATVDTTTEKLENINHSDTLTNGSERQPKGSTPESGHEDVFTSNQTKPTIKLQRKISFRRSCSSGSRSASVERASGHTARLRSPSGVVEDKPIVSRCLPENTVKMWAAQILHAINECHQTGLILRDLSPGNILLDEREQLKLTYYYSWPSVHRSLSCKKIQQLHVSPEVSYSGNVTPASDYWSFGSILFELLSGVSLVSVHPEGINSHTILKPPSSLSSEAQHLLKHLLKYNYRERLGASGGFEEIKSHPFFSTVDWTIFQS